MAVYIRQNDLRRLQESFAGSGDLESLRHPPESSLEPTLMDEAAAFGRIEIARWLVSKGDRLDQLNHQGQNVAFSAAAQNQVEMLAWLREQGLDMKKIDLQGDTCLMVAAARGNTAAVKWCLENLNFKLEYENRRRKTVRRWTIAMLWSLRKGHE